MGAAKALGIRPGEGVLVALVAALFATVEAGRGFGEVAADTLILRRSGPAILPTLFLVLGVVGLAVAIVYVASVGRARRDRFVPSVLLLLALVLLVERAALQASASVLLPIVWITVNASGSVLLTLTWTVASDAFDARQAKRLFPVCTSAAIAGGFAGTLLSGPAAAVAGTENVIVLEAVLLAAAAVVAARVGPHLRRPATDPDGGSALAMLRGGFDDVRRSPLLRGIAVAYVLFAVLLFSVSFPFLRAVAGAYTDEAQLATVLGLFSAGVTAASLVVSLLVANRVYARIGVTGAALLLPVVYLAGFLVWLTSFGLGTAVAFRFVQQVTQRGLSNSAWNAFFTIVPSARRGRVLAFIDGFPGQVGTIVSGLLLLAAASLAPTQVFLLGAVAAVLCVVIVWRIGRDYGRAILATLREGLAEQILEGGPGLVALGGDARVASGLRAALTNGTAGERRLAAALMGRLGIHDAAGDVAVLLRDPDPAVRLTAVESLGTLGALRGVDVEVLDSLGRDPDPAVRAELAVKLRDAGANVDRAGSIVAELLGSGDAGCRAAGLDAVARGAAAGVSPAAIAALASDAVPAVRAAALRGLPVLAASHTPSPIPPGEVTEILVRALQDEDSGVRRTAATVAAGRPGVAERVAEILEHGPVYAQESSLLALTGVSGSAGQRVVAWAEREADRAIAYRRETAALRRPIEGGDGTAAIAWLASLLERRRAATEHRLLTLLSVTGAPDAGKSIRRSLASRNPETRAQAIEALDAVGDRRLRRAAVRLIEDPWDGSPDEPIAVARRLSADPDPWVRGLALRTLAERLHAEWQRVAGLASDDADPIVRAFASREPEATDAHPGGGPAVPETQPTIGELDRMLFLRRVPLFGDLEPEDLQRIAGAATERRYEAGDEMMREGDVGDELLLLVQGSVRVVRHDGPNGAERLIRTYEAGAHIGELAVLREGTRAATVIAEAPYVRTLVLTGEALRSILTERPPAAMAMLATLADRITRQ